MCLVDATRRSKARTKVQGLIWQHVVVIVIVRWPKCRAPYSRWHAILSSLETIARQNQRDRQFVFVLCLLAMDVDGIFERVNPLFQGRNFLQDFEALALECTNVQGKNVVERHLLATPGEVTAYMEKVARATCVRRATS